jgi:hypothetical protein
MGAPLAARGICDLDKRHQFARCLVFGKLFRVDMSFDSGDQSLVRGKADGQDFGRPPDAGRRALLLPLPEREAREIAITHSRLRGCGGSEY